MTGVRIWAEGPYAVVVWDGTVSFIHDPGSDNEDQIRARVNAPPQARVALLPAAPVLPDWLAEWRCMVCGHERPDARISIAHRPIGGLTHMFPDARVNVRYCNDRLHCVATAHTEGPWKPAQLLPPPVYPETSLRLAPGAENDLAWLKDPDLGMLAVGILSWLRDQPALAQELLNAFDEPAQQILDMCRLLAGRGLVQLDGEVFQQP